MTIQPCVCYQHKLKLINQIWSVYSSWLITVTFALFPSYVLCFSHCLCLSMCLFKPDRLSPPLDIQLETINCTAFRVRWKMPRRHVSTITGYKVVKNCYFTFQCIYTCHHYTFNGELYTVQSVTIYDLHYYFHVSRQNLLWQIISVVTHFISISFSLIVLAWHM